ncbi:hypothetical protein LCGC14_0917880 [marine sediment metagenome]|uniref:Uncharacterized protein n=1 Tax=marine sediment metagenome TaxID=412755 RepID=A0A0F9RYA8_9ZZZZ
MNNHPDNQAEIIHFIGSLAALNDNKLADGVFRTFCKICYICWDIDTEDFKFTAPGTYSELSRLLSMDRKKVWRHITQLNTTSHIELRRHTESVFQIRPNYSGSPRLRDTGRANVPTTSFISTIIKDVNNGGEEEIKSSRANATDRIDLSNSAVWKESIDNKIFAFLTEHSIGDPARTKISLNNAVTFEMVKGHIHYGTLMDEPISYAVSRMLDGLPNPMADKCYLCAQLLPRHQNVMYQERENDYYKEGVCPNSALANMGDQDAISMINILNVERWESANIFNEYLANNQRDELLNSPVGKAFHEIRNLPRFKDTWLELNAYDKNEGVVIIETLNDDATHELLDFDKIFAEMFYVQLGLNLKVKFDANPNEDD